jgi:hypothetical protein
MPVLDPSLPRGIYRATLWNLLGDERWSFFGYAPNGEGEELTKLLNEMQHGCTLEVLQCDGASTLNDVEKIASRRAGCHAHGRMYLVDALKTGDARAIAPLMM